MFCIPNANVYEVHAINFFMLYSLFYVKFHRCTSMGREQNCLSSIRRSFNDGILASAFCGNCMWILPMLRVSAWLARFHRASSSVSSVGCCLLLLMTRDVMYLFSCLLKYLRTAPSSGVPFGVFSCLVFCLGNIFTSFSWDVKCACMS